MPQLDFSFYLSQISWLLVCFFTFFCVSKFMLLPRLDKILSNRKNIIDTNIEFANRTIKKANDIMEEYNSKIENKNREISSKVDDFIKEYKERIENEIEKNKREILF